MKAILIFPLLSIISLNTGLRNTSELEVPNLTAWNIGPAQDTQWFKSQNFKKCSF